MQEFLIALGVAGVTAIVGLLWRVSTAVAATKATLVGIDARFSDHVRFIEMILDRVLPPKEA